ncbi:MAG: glutathione-dependent formaldehyde dehydrogenase [Alphaproteobacteria bacterium]|nr:glutathione-dependent formaldehyde dehydrogenase [Alphaproteobacteria bacterium]
MKALVWHGRNDIRFDTVPDPRIEDPRDAILKVSSCAICGSDLHLHNGLVPGMKDGDIVGHEFMGEIVEVGSEVERRKVGERVVVPFTIICGECDQCKNHNFSVCERTNRNKEKGDEAFGHTTAGLYGYTHLTGGYAGGQAEYVRIPYADFGPVKVPDELSDEQVLFLGDILPTGWQAAIQCDIQPTDTVAVWGAGPVGQFCVISAMMLGAKQVICIDNVPERLALAERNGAIIINFDDENVIHRLNALTSGKGPEKCIDAVGMEAHAPSMLENAIDQTKQAINLESDRPHVLREMMEVCRPAGILSVPGVYGGVSDKIPFGMVMNKGLTIRTGQTHVNRWTDDLLSRIQRGEIDPTFIITDTVSLEEGPEMYKKFKNKEDGCIKVVMKPGLERSVAA